MNAFASSSSSTLAAVRRFGQPVRGARALSQLRRPSTLMLPIALLGISSRHIHSTITQPSPLSNPSRPPSIRSLIRDLRPLLIGSPSAFLLRRGITTAPSTTTPPRTSRTDPDPSEEDDPEPDPNLSAYARLKLLFKRYGWYALGMYTVLSALDFSLVFVLIHLAGAERIEPMLAGAVGWYRRQRYGEERAAELAVEAAEEAAEEKRIAEAEERDHGKGKKKKEKSGWMSRTVLAEMALAYPIHKVALLPVRAGLTVAWTPKFVGWLTRRGWVGKVSQREYEVSRWSDG